MRFDLRQLGWKAFQDLCAAVAAEVLGRPVQTFLPGNDGGRDAAFVGTWRGAADRPDTKSTIQCKFSIKADARLALANLRLELAKVAELAVQGLAHDYIIMTNAGVTGKAEAAICRAFQEAGAEVCRVFDGDWILRQVQERPRLRMMAPRVYGLLDLAELITGPGYDQARAILDSMGHDLASFLPTASHQAAVTALHEHGVVLLLGDPASGKSTIAATLALGALDDGCTGAVKISSPDQLHLWRPMERQFLWVDDAFGPTQYEHARIQQWNAELPRIKAAVRDGTKVVLTSRNYIWERARQHLKTSAFPLIGESQVVIDVQALSAGERAQILYNHVRNGGHPPETRRRIKPFLAGLANRPGMTPEIARRLGNPFMTRNLSLRRTELEAFVDHPVEFLKEVISNLSDAGRAALALIFMHPAIGLASPIPDSEALSTVCRITGTSLSEISKELEAMNGSLTLLTPGAERDRWVFRHPTIGDAYASLVAESPEQVELYVSGASLDRLFVEVVCGPSRPPGSKVRVAVDLYSELIRRMARRKLDGPMMAFLSMRCDAAFLRAFVDFCPETLQIGPQLGSELGDNPAAHLLAALHQAQCLPEELRRDAVERIIECTMVWMDVSVFIDTDVRSLLTECEYRDLHSCFRVEWIDDLAASWSRIRFEISSSHPLSHFRDFKSGLERVEHIFCDEDNAASFVLVHEEIDEVIAELEAAEPARASQRETVPAASYPLFPAAEIFDDIDGPD